MFLASKVAWAGIVFMLLTTGISGTRPTPLSSGADLSKEVPAVGHRNDVKKMQQTLRGKRHYRGKVDGVFGLRTRASIRGFQKAESLPVTKWAKGSGRTSKTLGKSVKTVAAPESGRGDGEKTLQAENDNHPQ
jgi:peptidoglycan hydrolase-like protein with peptidoglycan-binding domain